MSESKAARGTASAFLVFFGDPWAEAAGHPSALPVVKSSQFRFLTHSVKMGRSQMFVWGVTGQKRNYQTSSLCAKWRWRHVSHE